MDKATFDSLKDGDQVYAMVVYQDDPYNPKHLIFAGQTTLTIEPTYNTLIFDQAEEGCDWERDTFAPIKEAYSPVTVPGIMIGGSEDYEVIITDDKDVFNSYIDETITQTLKQANDFTEALTKGKV